MTIRACCLLALLACAGPRGGRYAAPPVWSPAADAVASCAAPERRGCATLGLDALSAGADGWAAAGLMLACEGGDAEGCAGLAVLHAEGRGVPRDAARASALWEAASARLSSAPALALGPDGHAVVPLPPRLAPAGAAAWDRTGQQAYADLLAPRRFHAELGIAPFLDAIPARADVEVVRFVSSARFVGAGPCVEKASGVPEAWASFAVEADGGTSDVRVAGFGSPELQRCLRERVESWVFPVPERVGARYLVHTRPPRFVKSEQLPAPGEPVLASPGYTKPRMAEPGCVQRQVADALQRRAAVPALTVKFAVAPDGAVRYFEVLSPSDLETAALVRRSVEACAWVPGTDETGAPIAIWVLLPFRFR